MARMEATATLSKGAKTQPLPLPRGITVRQAAELLRYSQDSILRMIHAGELVAIQPRGARGRRWLIDELSLHRILSANWQQAREATKETQAKLIQGHLPF